MTTYYVGPGGNNGNAGTSYALRKLTLNGAEDIPVVAGDTVIVAPGTYREALTVDVSGSAGNPITYDADITGYRTDGVGGTVRVTGSDNDTTATRAVCITATSKDYRTFRGFAFDTTTGILVSLITACGNWIVEDCWFEGQNAASTAINLAGTGINNLIRRCVFGWTRGVGIGITHSATVDNAGHLIENCLFINSTSQAVRIDRVGGVTVRNCFISGASGGVRVFTALTAGQLCTVNNCIIMCSGAALQATTTAEFSDNFNTLWSNSADRVNVTAGGSSVAFPPLFAPPQLFAGLALPWQIGMLSSASPLAGKVGLTEPAHDLYGRARPATAAKNSWGPIQAQPVTRDTTNFDAGSVGLTLPDASRVQFRTTVTATSTTISCRVKFDANYTGTKPQMVVKQPGQADVTVTGTGTAGSGTYETLTTTLTPSALPTWVVVELVSNNTDTANPATHQAHFDSLLSA